MDPTHFLAQAGNYNPRHRVATEAEIDTFYQEVGV